MSKETPEVRADGVRDYDEKGNRLFTVYAQLHGPYRQLHRSYHPVRHNNQTAKEVIEFFTKHKDSAWWIIVRPASVARYFEWHMGQPIPTIQAIEAL